ncbi:MAG: hypothetical protein MHM6MM_009678 [Cercozoa sp. M6MM]
MKQPLSRLRRLSAADRRASARIHSIDGNAVTDVILAVPAMAFGTYGMPLTILLYLVYFGWRAVLPMSLASLTTVAITEQLKKRVARRRPHHESIGKRKFNLRGLLKNHAFPSGDTAQAASVATTCYFLAQGNPAFLLCVPAAALGRVYFGAHWIGDVLAGALIGGVVAVVSFYLSSFAQPSM